MKVSFSRSKKKAAGFIISLEFILVMALVVFPLMVGAVLLGRKLITLYLNQKAMIEQPLARPVIWDSSVDASGNAKPVGPVIGYDRFEAPLVLYRDASTGIVVAGSSFEPGVLMGVRPNRFTTSSSVYYPTSDCSGDAAFIKSPSAATSPWPEVGFISQTQSINYAVGRGNNLYRATGGGATLGSGSVGSVWTSQDIGDSSPAGTPSTACQTLTFAAAVPPFGNLQLVSALSSNTDGIALAVTAADHNLRTGDNVSINTAIPFCPTLPGGICPPGFFNGTHQVTVTSPHSFTYDTGLPVLAYVTNTVTYTATCAALGVPCPVSALPGISFTLVSIPDLVSVAAPIARLTGAGNFVAPFKLAFPTAVPLAPLVPTGG